MKDQNTRDQFIFLRAEGKSFSTIAQELKISKGTCHEWEKQLQQEIAQRKAERLEELYERYFMARQQRIDRIGRLLERIDRAVEQADFTEADPIRLLDMRLKYATALKEEYIAPTKAEKMGDGKPEQIIKAMGDLLDRVRAGEVSAEQASKENMIFNAMLKGHEIYNLQEQVEALRGILEERK